ncbi:MAG: PD40 domain-containing protein [Cytophagales bacterium]|jgi:outer membrane protein OmpA-like peptidoglycan-associated protein|nr:PD40 domain-containing protein [Cytophagales bacterium]MCA6365895.1 PD40 domain-containing protein [Cytophagales bacterium]MCA6371291.1 PD40 domain-containing protein [Cytophagales bacterium]MCA6374941.1 PD40 domain-containing protein [Cytophagales bacterium]MCA6382750.1 PD40 domain-containing protein [Cytophagales bacterium]
MKVSFCTGILLLLLFSCSPEKKVKTAFKYAKYEKVIKYYKGVLARQPKNGKANYFVAESYRLSNRIKESEPYYAKAGGPGIVKDSVLLYYAKALQANAKYEEAKKTLDELESSSEDEKIKDRARKELEGLQYLDKLSEKKSYYRVKELESLNTRFAEYAPAYSNGVLYFASSRSNARIYEASGTPFTDIYQVDTKGANVELNTLKPLPKLINAPDVNTGCITFTPDGKLMIFARGNTGKRKGASDVDLYLSRFRNGQWGEPVPININQPNSWESTPALSPDGRTLYFSSNRKGGYGGLDIYSAQMDSRGRFGKIKNLGPDINTAGDDTFPYMADNSKLYFSSDGHPGYGMLDVFVVNRANGKTQIENLGQPMNSTSDDFGIYLFKPDRGFFTSNREGGKGDDDVYTFVNDDPNLKVVNYSLQGITYNMRKDSTREILADTKVSLLDQGGDVMQEFVTGNDGKFLFRVYENENYVLLGDHDGYIIKRQPYTTIGKSIPLESLKELVTNVTLDTLLVLDRLEKNKIFVLKNIYFEYNMADIRTDAAKELDKLVELLNDNPEIKIEMGSHTDSVASEVYNIELSQRRAESTVNYLIRKGIATERLVAKGYGESKPIARNTNPDGTDNPEGRQRNRRTEFKILEIGPIIKKDPKDFDEDKYFKDDGNE